MNATLRNFLAILALAAAVPASASIQAYPASRARFLGAPAHYEWGGGPRQFFLPGAWIVDDYEPQWRFYASGNTLEVEGRAFDARRDLVGRLSEVDRLRH